MTSNRLVHARYSLLKWQAVKLTFFAPCYIEQAKARTAHLFIFGINNSIIYIYGKKAGIHYLPSFFFPSIQGAPWWLPVQQAYWRQVCYYW